MPRFANMLAEGMSSRGHVTEIWTADAVLSKLSNNALVKKWLGYVDQYILFPFKFKRRARLSPKDTLFVFTDQALGPWVPSFAHRPHVIHCHDFLALQSALGEIRENPTGWTGRQYQQLIKQGFSKGKHFISVSKKTKADLEKYLKFTPETSEVVYNGFHQPFYPVPKNEARATLGAKVGFDLSLGYVLHIGGNIWYKNRKGVLEIYNAWRRRSTKKLPLIFIGEQPLDEFREIQNAQSFSDDVHWLSNIGDADVRLAYSGATVLLFPSLGEGFGWPIAESLASGTPVITTDEAPMNEVAGKVGFMIPRRPFNTQDTDAWVNNAACRLDEVVNLSLEESKKVIDDGLAHAALFDTAMALNKIEKIYKRIVSAG